jgi:hypothetical protein
LNKKGAGKYTRKKRQIKTFASRPGSKDFTLLPELIFKDWGRRGEKLKENGKRVNRGERNTL